MGTRRKNFGNEGKQWEGMDRETKRDGILEHLELLANLVKWNFLKPMSVTLVRT